MDAGKRPSLTSLIRIPEWLLSNSETSLTFSSWRRRGCSHFKPHCSPPRPTGAPTPVNPARRANRDLFSVRVARGQQQAGSCHGRRRQATFRERERVLSGKTQKLLLKRGGGRPVKGEGKESVSWHYPDTFVNIWPSAVLIFCIIMNKNKQKKKSLFGSFSNHSPSCAPSLFWAPWYFSLVLLSVRNSLF